MADNITLADGTIVGLDDIGGVKFLRVKIIHGVDGTNDGDVSNTNGMPVRLQAASAATTIIGTVQAPAITKGSQGTEGFTTQDLKDGGRVIVNVATVIAGVAGVGVEALLAMDVSRAAAATASATSHAVTANKRWRITSITAGIINTGAAIINARVSLRWNATGAALVTSPIIDTIPLATPGATAGLGDRATLSYPDGLEFSGSNQWGISHVGSAAGYTIWVAVKGWEY